MAAKSTQKPAQQPDRTPQNRQAITLELVIALAPSHTRSYEAVLRYRIGVDERSLFQIRHTARTRILVRKP
jgi:hypothetical protein